jgi:hypothetical protein
VRITQLPLSIHHGNVAQCTDRRIERHSVRRMPGGCITPHHPTRYERVTPSTTGPTGGTWRIITTQVPPGGLDVRIIRMTYLFSREHHPQYGSRAPRHSPHVLYTPQSWTRTLVTCESNENVNFLNFNFNPIQLGGLFVYRPIWLKMKQKRKTRHDSIITIRPLAVSFSAAAPSCRCTSSAGSVSLRAGARHGAAAHRSITNDTAARCQRAATQSKIGKKLQSTVLHFISFFRNLLFGDFNRVSIFLKIPWLIHLKFILKKNNLGYFLLNLIILKLISVEFV